MSLSSLGRGSGSGSPRVPSRKAVSRLQRWNTVQHRSLILRPRHLPRETYNHLISFHKRQHQDWMEALIVVIETSTMVWLLDGHMLPIYRATTVWEVPSFPNLTATNFVSTRRDPMASRTAPACTLPLWRCTLLARKGRLCCVRRGTHMIDFYMSSQWPESGDSLQVWVQHG